MLIWSASWKCVFYLKYLCVVDIDLRHTSQWDTFTPLKCGPVGRVNFYFDCFQRDVCVHACMCEVMFGAFMTSGICSVRNQWHCSVRRCERFDLIPVDLDVFGSNLNIWNWNIPWNQGFHWRNPLPGPVLLFFPWGVFSSAFLSYDGADVHILGSVADEWEGLKMVYAEIMKPI